MNKKLLSLCALLLCATTFASCTKTDNKVIFNENWLLDTTTTADVGAKETLTYSVTFEQGSNANNEYRSVSYGTGTYTTTLQTQLSENGNDVLYCYTTTLEIPVAYKHFATGGVFNATDVVTTKSVFHRKEKGLSPISSTKTVMSHSPTTADNPHSLEACYGTYNYTVSTVYNEDLSGTSKTIDHTKEENNESEVNFKPANDKYTTLDNEYLLLAIRGIEKLGSQKFNIYNSSWKTSQLVSLTASSDDSDEFTINETKRTMSYIPVTIKLDVKNSGSEQTIWVAQTTDITNNVNRNVILYMEMPVYYSYGTFQYTLTSAQYM